MARPIVDLPEPDSPDDAHPLAADAEADASQRGHRTRSPPIGDMQILDGEKRAFAH